MPNQKGSALIEAVITLPITLLIWVAVVLLAMNWMSKFLAHFAAYRIAREIAISEPFSIHKHTLNKILKNTCNLLPANTDKEQQFNITRVNQFTIEVEASCPFRFGSIKMTFPEYAWINIEYNSHKSRSYRYPSIRTMP